MNLVKVQISCNLGSQSYYQALFDEDADNDEIYKPNTSGAEVCSTSDQEDLPKTEHLVREFPKVLGETVENWMNATK